MGKTVFFYLFRKAQIIFMGYYAIFIPRKHRRIFTGPAAGIFAHQGAFPQLVLWRHFCPCLPSIIRIVNSPVILRGRKSGSRGNPLNYIPEGKCRCLPNLTAAFSFTKHYSSVNKEPRSPDFSMTPQNHRTHTSYHCFLRTHTVHPLL